MARDSIGFSVTVDTMSLINDVEKNMRSHKQAVEEARIGWREDMRKALKTALDKCNSGSVAGVYVNIPPVDDHTEDYARAIAMLEAHMNETIELGARDYAQYVQDEWDWKPNWVTSNSKYLGD